MVLPVVEYPSCRQTTVASVLPQPSSHTVPHTLFIQISTLPSLGTPPPTSRMSPVEQGTVKRFKQNAYNYSNDMNEAVVAIVITTEKQ